MPRNTDHIENHSAPQSAGMKLPSVDPTVSPIMMRNLELVAHPPSVAQKVARAFPAITNSGWAHGLRVLRGTGSKHGG